MRILLSNDDGVTAPGLAALADALAGAGELAIVAPADHQSAMAHAITVSDKLLVVAPAEVSGRPARAVGGTPADCVRLALRELLPARPDLVVAGINRGANIGINIFYSGTVAAAAEGAFEGIPAVAFSTELGETEPDFPAVAACCRRVLNMLLARGLAPGELINVNIPFLRSGWPLGVKVVPQSSARVVDTYIARPGPDGLPAYHISPDYEFHSTPGETDVSALAAGYITVTPLRMNLTNHDDLERLAQSDWGSWQ
ncbi:MAG: 5'/3'-nucleotidase SurE [Planctomycetota bacterium]|nr:5'/3'-nucleotidase SurE [Planctomycetota bacterium]